MCGLHSSSTRRPCLCSCWTDSLYSAASAAAEISHVPPTVSAQGLFSGYQLGAGHFPRPGHTVSRDRPVKYFPVTLLQNHFAQKVTLFHAKYLKEELQVNFM